MPHNFGPASSEEAIVYGAGRPGHWSPILGADGLPGYSVADVDRWIQFMQEQGIRRVCCLLGDELDAYETPLLDRYAEAFGRERVCHAPIEDFSFCPRGTLQQMILPFLFQTLSVREPVVVHCSAGCGRTGHVLAAWLVAGRGFGFEEAVAAVLAVPRVERNPLEAGSQQELNEVLAWAAETGAAHHG